LYNGLFTKAIGKWDISLFADYDIRKWKNFYGLGNKSVFTTKEPEFNRMLTKEFFGSAGIVRKWGSGSFQLSGFYQMVKLINDTSRFISKSFSRTFPVQYKTDNFVGVQASYVGYKVNDKVVPTKGYAFFGNASYSHNLKDADKSFGRYTGDLHLFVPLVSKFSLAIRVGGKTMTGTPDFYQYNYIGGGQTLRGYRRERWWGKSTFYNSNELRFINDVKSYLYNGKFGLVAFFDNGRVWMPSEKSNTLHTGYGGGILVSPFNKIAADITYSISEEIRLIQLRILMPFK
jgi:hemolysin activation/secretion protein